jgi:hypothetical protein
MFVATPHTLGVELGDISSPALQPERASGQRSKAAGVVIGLSKFPSWDRFGLVLASIWRMSVKFLGPRIDRASEEPGEAG